MASTAAQRDELPFSLEAEMSVLGGMLIDADAGIRATEFIRESDFHREAHRKLFRAMQQLQAVGVPIEPVTLSEQLKNAGDFEAAGGAAFLGELWDYVPSAANIEYHAEIVREKALAREVRSYSEALVKNPGDEVARRLMAKALAELEAGATREPRFHPLTDCEVEELPAPDQQIEGVLTANSLAVLVGAPEAGKTFLALAWALCISTGTPWCDREVRRGQVLYVAAEGLGGLGKRIRAWRTANHRTGTTGARFVTVPFSMLDPLEVNRFAREAIESLPEPPSLIVLDTLNRTFGGGDENATKDMGEYIRAADRLREATGATVLIVHHTGWDTTRERGNTSLRGAADTVMLLKSESDFLTLSCLKQKDLSHFAPIELRRIQVGESCALLTADRAPQLPPDELTEKQVEALRLLRTHFLDEGATATEWLKVSGLPERTFYDARTVLVRKGYVQQPAKPRGGRYTLTSFGSGWLTANCGLTADLLRRSEPKSLRAEEGGLRDPLRRSDDSAGAEQLVTAFAEDEDAA